MMIDQKNIDNGNESEKIDSVKNIKNINNFDESINSAKKHKNTNKK